MKNEPARQSTIATATLSDIKKIAILGGNTVRLLGIKSIWPEKRMRPVESLIGTRYVTTVPNPSP
jgi:hypothetical protein